MFNCKGFFVYLYMASLNQYIRSLEVFKNNLPKTVDRIILKNAKFYIGQVQNRLFHEGYDGNGSDLGEYSLSYREFKKDKGATYTHITLYNNGDFYDKMFLTSSFGDVEIFSKDPKTLEILEMFSGFDIFGLTFEEQNILLINAIDPGIQEVIDKLPKIIDIKIK